jgi:hypothetical protein
MLGFLLGIVVLFMLVALPLILLACLLRLVLGLVLLPVRLAGAVLRLVLVVVGFAFKLVLGVLGLVLSLCLLPLLPLALLVLGVWVLAKLLTPAPALLRS